MSTMNTEEKLKLEEKNPRIEECKENANENLSQIEEDKEMDKKDVSDPQKTELDLYWDQYWYDHQPHRHRRLPLEMECEVFKNFKLEIQQKFIWRMGRGIYGIFRHKLLTKTKRLCNPKSNFWSAKNVLSLSSNLISADGLGCMSNKNARVYAEQGFGISVKNARNDDFPGTILYYFEVTQLTSTEHKFYVGFAGDGPNLNELYHFFRSGYDYYWLSGNLHRFQWSNGALGPISNGIGDVYGCGLLLSPEHKLAIFFTGNGVLLGKQIPVATSANFLVPCVLIKEVSLKANFGDDSTKNPFKYDIRKCPGLVFE